MTTVIYYIVQAFAATLVKIHNFLFPKRALLTCLRFFLAPFAMAFVLPHLHSGWAVDQAIIEEQVLLRFSS
jgi:hypothetical protein